MTLDEAIKHAREVAEKNRKNCKPNSIIIQNRWADSTMCAEEHDQLADWLEELKAIREYIEPLRNTNTHNEYLEELKKIAKKK